MSDLRGSRRFEAAPSSSPLMWGVGLVAVGMVVREAAVERHLDQAGLPVLPREPGEAVQLLVG